MSDMEIMQLPDPDDDTEILGDEETDEIDYKDTMRETELETSGDYDDDFEDFDDEEDEIEDDDDDFDDENEDDDYFEGWDDEGDDEYY